MEATKRILQYKEAALLVGLSVTELYTGLRSGKYPGYRAGGKHGRWLVDIEMLEKRIQDLMQENIRVQESQNQIGVLRRIDAGR